MFILQLILIGFRNLSGLDLNTDQMNTKSAELSFYAFNMLNKSYLLLIFGFCRLSYKFKRIMESAFRM